MKNLKFLFFAVLSLLLLALPVLAQPGAGGGAGGADNQQTVDSSRAIAAGLALIGFGLAAGLGGIGQGLIGSSAASGVARNPGAAGRIQTVMILALALVESLVLFALLVVFLKIT